MSLRPIIKALISKIGYAYAIEPALARTARSQGDIPPEFYLEKLRGFDVFDISIPQLGAAYKNMEFTAVEYTRFLIARIQSVNVYLECVIEINPDALQIAEKLDSERLGGKVRGPLHGVPVLVKDNIATKDKMQTTGGSWALLGCVVPRDAHVVSLLRNAGAIILGHANMSEWASTRSRYYSDGYSPRGGQTRNPFNLVQSPFGSSGGSAVSVSANIVPLSIGTETDGSIAGPSQSNSVVGIKPTPGLTSRSGVIPCSENFDTIGPFGRSVIDATLGLDAIVGADATDARSTGADRITRGSYVDFISDKTVLKGARFGLPIKGCWEFVPEDQKKVAEKILDGIKAAGAEVIDVDYPCAEERIPGRGIWDWEHGEPSKSEYTVVKVDAYESLNAYFSELTNTCIRTVEDVVKFNTDNKGTEGAAPGDHPAFRTGHDVLIEIIKGRGEKTLAYNEALKHIRCQTRANGIDSALQHVTANGESVTLDALILCDRRLVGQQLAAQAGYPTITFPIGTDKDGMPLGLTLQQTAWQEGKLIKWASAIEDLRNDIVGGRPLPTYKNKTAKNIPIRYDYT
ncbi:hypothetical protein V491_02830 [Pseudogymnoascus sp. VKM F-3775]|nr:hypothetical protein V491_02830 [Pseudogymnoascus sp. VKM F-3775]